MTFYSICPFFVGITGLLLLTGTSLFASADTPPSPQPHRIRTLDGFRGFLALAVFFHHAAIYHLFLLRNDWNDPPSRFYNGLGHIAVGFFFMITGYLFWSKLIAENGRVAWRKLYLGRAFRIAPLYLFAFGCIAIVALALTGFHLTVSGGALCLEIARSLTLGVLRPIDINHFVHTDLLLDAVTWTLRDEWFFYLSLPLLAIFARSQKWHLPAVACLLSIGMVGKLISPVKSHSHVLDLFLWGMLAASLLSRKKTLKIPDRISSAAVMLLFLGSFNARSPVGFQSVLCMGVAFYLISSGSTLFGLLTSTPARRLGDISYGIYLLQGLPQALFFRPPIFKSIALASPIGHWSLAILASVALIGLAALTHVYIERPGIAFGKLIARRPSVNSHSLKPFQPQRSMKQ